MTNTITTEQLHSMGDRDLLLMHKQLNVRKDAASTIVAEANTAIKCIEAVLLQRATATNQDVGGFDGSTFKVNTKQYFNVSGEQGWTNYCSYVIKQVAESRDPYKITHYFTKKPMTKTLKDTYEATGVILPGASITEEQELKITHPKG